MKGCCWRASCGRWSSCCCYPMARTMKSYCSSAANHVNCCSADAAARGRNCCTPVARAYTRARAGSGGGGRITAGREGRADTAGRAGMAGRAAQFFAKFLLALVGLQPFTRPGTSRYSSSLPQAVQVTPQPMQLVMQAVRTVVPGIVGTTAARLAARRLARSCLVVA